MELEELKSAWEQMERRVDVAETTIREFRQERAVATSRRLLMHVTAGQTVQTALSVASIALVAPFWVEHRQTPHLLIAGLSLHLYFVGMICACAMQILLLGQIYHTESVVSCQQKTLKLQRLRVLSGLALGLPWWILWVPTMMVGAQRFAGIDLYRASPGWMQLSLAAGLVGIVASILVARLLDANPFKAGTARSVVDALSGRSLTHALRKLEEINRFEQE